MSTDKHTDVSRNGTSAEKNGKATDPESQALFARILLDLGNLARVEAVQAASRLPGLCLLWVLRIPVLVLVWISFSLMVAWAVYEITTQAFIAYVVLFLLQIIVLLMIEMNIRKRKYLLSLPESRRQAERLREQLHKGKSQA